MKRSEMITKIGAYLFNNADRKIIKKGHHLVGLQFEVTSIADINKFAEGLLQKIENSAMLPPSSEICGVNWEREE